MHGYFGAELLTEISGIAGMVKISVGYHDKLKIADPAACVFKFFFKFGPPVWTPRVDQNKPVIGFYEETIYTA